MLSHSKYMGDNWPEQITDIDWNIDIITILYNCIAVAYKMSKGQMKK